MHNMRYHIPVPPFDFILVPTLGHEGYSSNFVDHSRMVPKALGTSKNSGNPQLSKLIEHEIVILIK